MKKSILLSLAGALCCYSSVAVEAATTKTINVVKNRYFEGGDNATRYAGWNTSDGAWRGNGDRNNLVFDFKNDGSTATWNSASTSLSGGGIFDLTTHSDLTSVAGFDSSTAQLTGVSWKDEHWITDAGRENIGEGFAANFYLEVILTTDSGGLYTAASEQLAIGAGGVTNGPVSFDEYNWQTWGENGGNPFEGGEGIILDDIADIEFKLVMNVGGDNSNGDGTYFFTVDNVGLDFDVTIPTLVPEPSSVVMLSLGGLALAMRRRRDAA